MSGRTYGHTKSGKAIDDSMIEELAAEAERGYGPEQLVQRRRGRGRPPLGEAAKSVESVRLDPELREKLLEAAKAKGTTPSEVIREALREFLRAG